MANAIAFGLSATCETRRARQAEQCTATAADRTPDGSSLSVEWAAGLGLQNDTVKAPLFQPWWCAHFLTHRQPCTDTTRDRTNCKVHRRSEFGAGWLRAHSYSNSAHRAERAELASKSAASRLWTASSILADGLPFADYAAVMASDASDRRPQVMMHVLCVLCVHVWFFVCVFQPTGVAHLHVAARVPQRRCTELPGHRSCRSCARCGR